MSRRRVIALMMANAGLGGDYQGLLRSGVEQRCSQADVDLWVYAGRFDWQTNQYAHGRIYDLVAPERVDGIVLAAATLATFLDLHELHETLRHRCAVPMCSAGYHLPGVPSITVDNGSGMARVVEHLAAHHRRRHFAFIAGPEGHVESEERLRAARGALARHGLELPDEAVNYGNFSAESGTQGMRELVAHLGTIDAVVAANDDMAAGALKTLVRLGRRCPEDVAISGFDDAPSSRVCTPSMTTVRQPAFQMGVQAVECILAAWRGEAGTPLATLLTEPVLRGSCGCDPVLGERPRVVGVIETVEPQPREELATLLKGVVGDERRSVAWADRIWQALGAERAAQHGALRKVMEDLLSEVSRPDAPLVDLQRVVTYLRSTHTDKPCGVDVNEIYHQALVQIGDAMNRREMTRRLHDGFLVDELRINWKRLATALSLDSLRDVLTQGLPDFSVKNAMVSVYPVDDFENLMPLACLVEGVPVALEPTPFPACRLWPDGIPMATRRVTFAVLPLTFESEPLGVAMLELPAEEAYQVLREQIGSAIKTVRLHETLMQQQERLKRQAQIENQAAAERLRSMSLIAGGVAHDLNNTLGPLLALPDAMRRDMAAYAGSLPEQILLDLEVLQEAAQHAAHTIRDLLILGRTFDVSKRTMDVNRILEFGQRGLAQQAERTRGVRLRLLPADAPLLVHVSREHVLRAVSNLVANAADATRGPGEIVVRVQERKLSRRLDGIEPVEPGHYAVIKVEDSGCGIPGEILPHILEPFFSSKLRTPRGGTGLGLAIVHQAIRQCGGYVQVQSQVGTGTTFSLYLPLVSDGVVAESAPPVPAAGGSERILVVDDEQIQLRTAQRLLKQLGYRVWVAESGAAAIAIFEQHVSEDPFDLVILDVMMPGTLNGPATLERLRQMTPDLKALFATGYAPEQLASEMSMDGTPWLAKPYTASNLASAVRSALQDFDE